MMQVPLPHHPTNKVMVVTAPLMEAVVAIVITMVAVSMAAEVAEGLEDTMVVEEHLNLLLITAITQNRHLEDPKTVSFFFVMNMWSVFSFLVGGYIPPEEWVKPLPRNERLER